MRILSLFTLTLLLISCNNAAKKKTDTKDTDTQTTQIPPPPPPPAAPDTIFTGLGNEPFWAVYVIKDSKILFHPADGPDVEVPYVPASSGPASILYNSSGNGNSIELTIIKKDCSDGMSDIIHTHEVQLRVNNTKYTGCSKEGK